MSQDWRDALASLRGSMEPDAPEDTAATNGAVTPDNSERDGAHSDCGKRRLRLFYEKKGRAGKPATIIEGFDLDDDSEALRVARTLKQRIGCGGSARGGEILLQGDRREKAAELLREMGYRC